MNLRGQCKHFFCFTLYMVPARNIVTHNTSCMQTNPKKEWTNFCKYYINV
jgi:hypothetical protein